MTGTDKWFLRYRRPTSGFTLIELLVVISIIALLLSIMMPALSRVREAGRAVLCASNQRQVGIGMELYIADHGFYPAHRVVGPGPTWLERTSSLERLGDYMNFDWEVREMYDWYTKRMVETKYSNLLACPSVGPMQHYIGFNIVTDFGVNLGMSSEDYYDKGFGISYFYGYREWMEKRPYSRRATDVRRPSTFLYVMDSDWDYVYRSQTQVTREGPDGVEQVFEPDEIIGARYIHAGSTNALFADGHVERVSGPASVDYLRFR